MASASFKLLKCTGTTAATETDCSKHPTYLNSDLTSTDTASYPVAAPSSAGTNYSFEVWLRWEMTAVADNYVKNFKFYGPSSAPDSLITIYAGATSTAATPKGTVSTVATTQQDTNYYQVGNALAITISEASSQLDAIGEQTDYLVLQARIGFGAPQGDITTQTYSVTYEEV